MKSGSAGGHKKKYVYFDCMQFLDKKHVIDTEDSIVESQKTMDESLSNSKPTTNDDALPSTSKDSNFCQPIQTAASEQKNVQAKRFKKRTRIEDVDFDKEMLNMFKENTKLIQNDDMSFFCSLLPIMKTFSNHQKLLFRSAVIQKAIKISSSSNEDRPGTSHTGSTSDSQHSDASTPYVTQVSQQYETPDEDSSEIYPLEDYVTVQYL